MKKKQLKLNRLQLKKEEISTLASSINGGSGGVIIKPPQGSMGTCVPEACITNESCPNSYECDSNPCPATYWCFSGKGNSACCV